MPTKYLVILFIIVAIGGGLYFFQKHRQNKDLQTHKTQQLQRITKIAQKSGTAGLVAMASAINKFYQVKGHYPKTLINLYPQFIPHKPFISTIKWQYHPEKNSYLLQKSAGAERGVASIGPDLRLRTGDDVSVTPAKMVASVDKSTSPKKSKTPQKSVKKTGGINVSQAGSDPKKNTKNNQLAKLSTQGSVKITENINLREESTPYKSDLLSSVVKKKLNKNEEFLRSFDGDNFYIWKSKDGTIGFSNMQYPDENKLAVYRNQSWIEYIEQ
ncbi:MAG: hypothetical protein K8R67_19330 [Desulfobacteraceae bacterium]|nr:hypothetical protein [Desulfobacteraceae bacterium]